MASRWKRAWAWLTDQPGAVRLSGLAGIVSRASQAGALWRDLDDAALAKALEELPPEFINEDASMAEFLAIMRELADRTVGLRPYDVQMQATAAMLRGTSIELATGEGKTLVGAMVAAGLIRANRTVQILSANDYLADRDATWMGPLLTAAGASVGVVTSDQPHAQRVESYQADVVYVPVTEAGFDVLRDRIRFDESDLLAPRHDAAILDEADAVLLDEARVPLVLAGESTADHSPDTSLAAFVATLVEGRDFDVDSERRAVHLNERGLQAVEVTYPDADLFGDDHQLLSRINVALYAHALLRRDVDYVVSEGKVNLVSQSRGRVEALQRWPEGLQEAVEAKEGLDVSARVDVLDQLLVRDLIGKYSSVVGMSATLVVAAEELRELYDMSIGSLPPNRPCVREDEQDRMFETAAARDAAAAAFVAEVHETGQPVLVATQSVAESERFAQLLADEGLESVVLNAKNDAVEAQVIAQAGTVGRITVSTQMAGRGTDIRLGEGASDLGGLCIVGLQRFRSARLDGQLRGRSARQGDPGRSIFFTSLEDDLVVENMPDHRPPASLSDEGEVSDRQLLGLVDQAQRISDGQQGELRSLARRYGSLPALQREDLLAVRDDVLRTDRGTRDLRLRIADRLDELADEVDEAELERAARAAVLGCLDRGWSDHLAFSLELREGIHLRALARLEPLSEYNKLLVESFTPLVDVALDDAAALLTEATVSDGHIDLDSAGLYRPGATWTYMVTDDHFGSEWARIGRFFARRNDVD